MIGSFIGIFFLSLNKASNGETENLVPGLLLVFLAALLEALIIISLRMLNIYQIHPMLRPAFIGILSPIFALAVYCINPDTMVFPNYSLTDLVFLSLAGVGNSF